MKIINIALNKEQSVLLTNTHKLYIKTDESTSNLVEFADLEISRIEKVVEVSEELTLWKISFRQKGVFDDMEMDPRIKKVLDYIHENIENNISLEEASKFVPNISTSYFGQFFKRKVGMTFIDYILQQRVNRATRLLEKTPMKISEIAKKCGFNDMAYFSKAYKNIKGFPPSAVRK